MEKFSQKFCRGRKVSHDKLTTHSNVPNLVPLRSVCLPGEESEFHQTGPDVCHKLAQILVALGLCVIVEQDVGHVYMLGRRLLMVLNTGNNRSEITKRSKVSGSHSVSLKNTKNPVTF
jgi:hypothetical protein